MARIDQLYQDVVLAHNRAPCNRGVLEPCSHQAHGRNPICGDAVTLTLRIEGDVIEAVRFEGESCAISTASASLLTEVLTGCPVEEAERLARAFQSAILGADDPDERAHAEAVVRAAGESLEALLTVQSFPGRERCATLAWETLLDALARPVGR